jgi:Tfp pilus assembly protein PilN
MLSKLKKPTPDAAELAVLAWHPDFRNRARLPDTKVVRTSFLLNGAAILVAAVLFMGMAYRVYQWRELTTQIDQWQRQIDRDKNPSDQAIKLYKQFQLQATQVNAVNAFLTSRPLVSELLLQLGKSLPDYLALDQFELGSTSLNIRGTVRGEPDQASGRASTYLQQLKDDPFFAAKFTSVDLVSLNRDPKSGGLVLEINLKLREGKKS